MSDINMSRKLDAHKKRGVSVAAVDVNLADAVKQGAVQGDVLQLSKLPSNSLVLGLRIVLLEVADVAATITPDTGAGGGTIAAFDIGNGATAAVGDNISYDYSDDDTLGLTDTGVLVTTALTTLAAGATVGRFLLVVEYLEYTKTSGELTQLIE